MKSILLSIKPEWLAKILNGEKTIEVRKLFPKDYVGWVYLYCSKDKKNYLYRPRELREFWNCGKQVRKGVFNYSIIHKAPQNYCYIEGE